MVFVYLTKKKDNQVSTSSLLWSVLVLRCVSKTHMTESFEPWDQLNRDFFNILIACKKRNKELKWESF